LVRIELRRNTLSFVKDALTRLSSEAFVLDKALLHAAFEGSCSEDAHKSGRDLAEMARKFLWDNIHDRFIRKYGAAKTPITNYIQTCSLYNISK
jgi:hypothetical protein